MLIVSKFHDYYDTIAKLGIDKAYVYKRNEQALKGIFGKKDRNGHRNSWPYDETYSRTRLGGTTSYMVHKMVIGFCGKLYPVIIVDKTFPNEKSERHSLYTTEKVYEFFEKEKVALEDKHRFWSMRDFSVKSKKSLDNFFSGSEFKDLELEFHRHKVPIFIYGRFADSKKAYTYSQDKEQLVLNPRLKDYGFVKVKDPVSAFQDIYMFISGILGLSHMEMPEFTDKQKAQQKGHDGKYSFRKPPGKRGKKQWR